VCERVCVRERGKEMERENERERESVCACVCVYGKECVCLSIWRGTLNLERHTKNECASQFGEAH